MLAALEDVCRTRALARDAERWRTYKQAYAQGILGLPMRVLKPVAWCKVLVVAIELGDEQSQF